MPKECAPASQAHSGTAANPSTDPRWGAGGSCARSFTPKRRKPRAQRLFKSAAPTSAVSFGQRASLLPLRSQPPGLSDWSARFGLGRVPWHGGSLCSQPSSARASSASTRGQTADLAFRNWSKPPTGDSAIDQPRTLRASRHVTHFATAASPSAAFTQSIPVWNERNAPRTPTHRAPRAAVAVRRQTGTGRVVGGAARRLGPCLALCCCRAAERRSTRLRGGTAAREHERDVLPRRSRRPAGRDCGV